LLGGSVCIVWL